MHLILLLENYYRLCDVFIFVKHFLIKNVILILITCTRFRSCFNLFFHLTLRVALRYNLLICFNQISYFCINFLSIAILGYNSYLQKIK